MSIHIKATYFTNNKNKFCGNPYTQTSQKVIVFYKAMTFLNNNTSDHLVPAIGSLGRNV